MKHLLCYSKNWTRKYSYLRLLKSQMCVTNKYSELRYAIRSRRKWILKGVNGTIDQLLSEHCFKRNQTTASTIFVQKEKPNANTRQHSANKFLHATPLKSNIPRHSTFMRKFNPRVGQTNNSTDENARKSLEKIFRRSLLDAMRYFRLSDTAIARHRAPRVEKKRGTHRRRARGWKGCAWDAARS